MPNGRRKRSGPRQENAFFGEDNFKKLDDFINNIFRGYQAGKELYESVKKPNPYVEFLTMLDNEDWECIYKALVKRYHPDHGGNEEKMKRLNVMWAEIKKDRKIR